MTWQREEAAEIPAKGKGAKKQVRENVLTSQKGEKLQRPPESQISIISAIQNKPWPPQ